MYIDLKYVWLKHRKRKAYVENPNKQIMVPQTHPKFDLIVICQKRDTVHSKHCAAGQHDETNDLF